VLLGLWERSVDTGVRHAIIQGLSEWAVFSAELSTHLRTTGVIFRAYPTMMLEESSTNLMDQCFSTDASGPETVLRMLTLLHDCLSADKGDIELSGNLARTLKAQSEVRPLLLRNKSNLVVDSDNIDISKLIGNTSNFAESG
jgi:hypothetical protein